MRTIKENIYEKLSPRQRIVANLDALARGDKDEEGKLSKTCPKYTYRMNDHSFCMRMEAIQFLALLVEHDLRSFILEFFMNSLFYEIVEFSNYEELAHEMREWPDAAQNMLSIKKAWHGFLEEEGIDPRVVDKAYADIEHSMTSRFLSIAFKIGLLPDECVVEEYKGLLRCYYDEAA
tara:strand:+ start:3314 stop:3844 length:531 start_codon:yes stop_codon:yes gene_type:complete